MYCAVAFPFWFEGQSELCTSSLRIMRAEQTWLWVKTTWKTTRILPETVVVESASSTIVNGVVADWHASQNVRHVVVFWRKSLSHLCLEREKNANPFGKSEDSPHDCEVTTFDICVSRRLTTFTITPSHSLEHIITFMDFGKILYPRQSASLPLSCMVK